MLSPPGRRLESSFLTHSRIAVGQVEIRTNIA